MNSSPTFTTDSLKLDVDAILRQRLPRHYRYIPRWMIQGLARFICQDEMNALLLANHDKKNADFCRGVLHHLNIHYNVDGDVDGLKALGRRVVLACNHPLGGLDGLSMIDFVASTFGEPVKFVVNDLLMAIKPLQEVFLPINKHGRQSRVSSASLDEEFAGDNPIVVFPAGLVSRRQKGEVADLRWHKMFVNKSIQYDRPIVPIHFSGQNSSSFYTLAKLRTMMGIKFNFEMVCLPREVFRNRNATFTITIGQPVAPTSLKGGTMADRQAQDLRSQVYRLPLTTAS
ncbi:MAG: glycerol acyltransferase [Bacteroidales bacterium]|nr:glycerol acyltransferase [Bacteroidales bacterium]